MVPTDDGAFDGISGAQMTGHLAQGLSSEAMGKESLTAKPADTCTSDVTTNSGFVHNPSSSLDVTAHGNIPSPSNANCFDIRQIHPSVMSHLRTLLTMTKLMLVVLSSHITLTTSVMLLLNP